MNLAPFPLDYPPISGFLVDVRAWCQVPVKGVIMRAVTNQLIQHEPKPLACRDKRATMCYWWLKPGVAVMFSGDEIKLWREY